MKKQKPKKPLVVGCRFCKESMHPSQLVQHLAEAHNFRPVAPRSVTPPPAASATELLIGCRYCNLPLKPSEMLAHLAEIHDVRPKKEAVKPSISPFAIQSPPPKKRGTVKVVSYRPGDAKPMIFQQYQAKPSFPIGFVSNKKKRIFLTSKRGTRLTGNYGCCECLEGNETVFRYSESNMGEVFICLKCKSKVFDRSFDKIDVLSMPTTVRAGANG